MQNWFTKSRRLNCLIFKHFLNRYTFFCMKYLFYVIKKKKMHQNLKSYNNMCHRNLCLQLQRSYVSCCTHMAAGICSTPPHRSVLGAIAFPNDHWYKVRSSMEPSRGRLTVKMSFFLFCFFTATVVTFTPSCLPVVFVSHPQPCAALQFCKYAFWFGLSQLRSSHDERYRPLYALRKSLRRMWCLCVKILTYPTRATFPQTSTRY